MKLIYVIIISFLMSGNCIQFEDSALDPNSTISQLRLLLGLFGSNATTQTTIEMNLKKSDSSNYGGNFLEFGRPSTQASSRNIDSKNLSRAIENASRISIRSDGFVKVTLNELGVFEFIIKSPSGDELASFQLNIISGLDNDSISLLIPTNVSGDIVVEIISIVQTALSGEPILLSYKVMGNTDNKIFSLGQMVIPNANGQFTLQTQLLASVDGKSFSSIPIPGDFFQQNFESLGTVEKKILLASNVVQHGDKYFFLVSEINANLETIATYGIHTDGFTITQDDVYEVNSRSSLFTVIDEARIFSVANKLIYGARNPSTGYVEMRLDSNFLRDGSTNVDAASDLFAINPVNPPNVGFTSPLYLYEHKGGIAYPQFVAIPDSFFSSNDTTTESYMYYMSGPVFSAEVFRSFAPSKNQIFILQSRPDGLGEFDIQISLVSTFAFTNDPINVDYSSTIKSPTDINFVTPMKEFGSKFAYPVFNFSTSQIGLILGEGSSWNYVSILGSLEIAATEFIPDNLTEMGDNLYYFHSQNSQSNGITTQVRSTNDGTNWTSFQDIIIN